MEYSCPIHGGGEKKSGGAEWTGAQKRRGKFNQQEVLESGAREKTGEERGRSWERWGVPMKIKWRGGEREEKPSPGGFNKGGKKKQRGGFPQNANAFFNNRVAVQARKTTMNRGQEKKTIQWPETVVSEEKGSKTTSVPVKCQKNTNPPVPKKRANVPAKTKEKKGKTLSKTLGKGWEWGTMWEKGETRKKPKGGGRGERGGKVVQESTHENVRS